MKVLHHLLAAGLVVGGAASTSLAVPIILDDFDNDEGHFSFSPTLSGSNRNLTVAGTTADREAFDGYMSVGSERLVLNPDEAAPTDFPGGGAPREFRIRFLSGNPGSNANGGNQAQNVNIGPDGYVGYFVKTTTPGLTASITLDDNASGTTEISNPQPIIADGGWHLVQFNLDDAVNEWNNFNAGNGAIDGPTVSIDALIIRGPTNINGAAENATVFIDKVAYNQTGDLSELVPEPTAVALLGLGALGVATRARRRRCR